MSILFSKARRLAVAVVLTVATWLTFSHMWTITGYMGLKNFEAGMFAGACYCLLPLYVFIAWRELFYDLRDEWLRYR